jgi:tetratricopeptide (TPR) repeat protein
MKVTLTETYLNECLKQARYYEYCKEPERALAILNPVWDDIETTPRIEGLSDRLAWEVLLICGNVISVYGTTHKKKHCKELASDVLTRARELAIRLDDRDLIGETEKQMAVVYWRHGQYENAIAYLNTVLSRYSEAEQLTNRICLLAQANLLVLYLSTNELAVAFETFQKIKPFVDESEDLWLKTTFYNQAAGLYVFTGKFAHAIPLLEKTIEYATLSKNNSYLGNALNNLANAYLNLPDTSRAAEYVDRAIELYLSINQVFLYALALETKSQIYAAVGDSRTALELIDESIDILQQGESYGELCDSLWTRTLILAKMGEKTRAIRQFNRLIQIATEHLNLVATNRYTDKFGELFYLSAGENLDEKEANYRKHLIDEALSACGGIVTTSAKHLGIMHQRLSVMLKRQPELCEKYQVKLRTRSSSSAGASSNAAETASSTQKRSKDLFGLRVKSNRLTYFGIEQGKIISVLRLPSDELDLTKPVVIQDSEKQYHCGFLVDAFGMFAFEDGQGNLERTFLPGEIIESGQVVGIFDEKTNNFIPLEGFE